MAAIRDSRHDATVMFLPNRLNRQPVVVRGLTADELWITVGVSTACGLAVGIAIAGLTHRLAMVPTSVVLCIAAGVFVGGTLLRGKKRGRPDTWLHRQMQWSIARRFPAVSGYLGADELITRSGYWTTRREARR